MVFLRVDEILRLHASLIEVYGGIHGVRDFAALQSALAAPEQRAYYEQADLAACAATYAYHLMMAHAFLDGNKRIAAAACELFIRFNEATLLANDADLILFFLAIADGQLSRDEVEAQLRGWIRGESAL